MLFKWLFGHNEGRILYLVCLHNRIDSTLLLHFWNRKFQIRALQLIVLGVKSHRLVQVGSRGNYTLQAVSSYPDTCQGDSGGPVFIKGMSHPQACLLSAQQSSWLPVIGLWNPKPAFPPPPPKVSEDSIVHDWLCIYLWENEIRCQWLKAATNAANPGSSAASDVVLGTVAFGDGCGRNLPSVYNSIPVSCTHKYCLITDDEKSNHPFRVTAFASAASQSPYLTWMTLKLVIYLQGYTNASIFDNFLTTIMQKIPNSLASSNWSGLFYASASGNAGLSFQSVRYIPNAKQMLSFFKLNQIWIFAIRFPSARRGTMFSNQPLLQD